MEKNVTKRIAEIESSVHAFEHGACRRADYLPELMRLQSELIDLTFGTGTAAANGKLRIFDVVKALAARGAACPAAAGSLQRFTDLSNEVSGLIRSEIVGVSGEKAVAKKLRAIDVPCRVLYNVELGAGSVKGEIDLVAITKNGVFLLEIKNTKCAVEIGEDGVMTKRINGKTHRVELENKLIEKETLLQKAFFGAGLTGVKINTVVVFTNAAASVENRCDRMTVCTEDEVCALIEGYRDDTPGQDIYPAKLECAIRSAETEGLYPPDFDVRDYVRCFAETLALIENAGKKPAARSILQQLSKLRTQAAGFRRHVA